MVFLQKKNTFTCTQRSPFQPNHFFFCLMCVCVYVCVHICNKKARQTTPFNKVFLFIVKLSFLNNQTTRENIYKVEQEKKIKLSSSSSSFTLFFSYFVLFFLCVLFVFNDYFVAFYVFATQK